VFKAAEALKAGSIHSLNLKLWEGEIDHPIEDNRPVGVLKIMGTDFEDDVIRAGAALRCDYEILDSGTITMTVTVESVGATFNSHRNFYSPQEAQIDLSAAAARIAEAGESMRRRLDDVSAHV